jgi:DNA-binding protein H-NS
MSDISSVQYITGTEIARQDAEEAFLIQEYDKVKAKLAQIQEKLKRKGLEKNEKVTASAAVLEYEEEVAVSTVPTPDPKGVVNYEHEDIITILSDI